MINDSQQEELFVQVFMGTTSEGAGEMPFLRRVSAAGFDALKGWARDVCIGAVAHDESPHNPNHWCSLLRPDDRDALFHQRQAKLVVQDRIENAGFRSGFPTKRRYEALYALVGRDCGWDADRMFAELMKFWKEPRRELSDIGVANVVAGKRERKRTKLHNQAT